MPNRPLAQVQHVPLSLSFRFLLILEQPQQAPAPEANPHHHSPLKNFFARGRQVPEIKFVHLPSL